MSQGDQTQGKKGRPRISFTEAFDQYSVTPSSANQPQQPSPSQNEEAEVEAAIRRADSEATKNLLRAMNESKLMRIKTEEEVKTAELELKKAEIEQKKEQLKPAPATDKEGAGAPGAVELNDVDAAFVKSLPGMKSDEERAIALSAWKSLRQRATAKGGETMADLMQVLMLKQFTDHGAGSSVSSITETANALGTLLDRFSPQGQPEGTSITEKVVEKLLASMPAPQAQTPVQQDLVATIKGLREAGVMYSPRDVQEMLAQSHTSTQPLPPPGPSNTALEMQRMDWDFKLKMQQMADERQFKKDTLTADSERTKVLTDGFKEVIGSAADALGKGEAASLDQAGASGAALRTAPADAVAEAPCKKCGATLVIPQPSMAGDITCPECHTIQHWSPN